MKNMLMRCFTGLGLAMLLATPISFALQSSYYLDNSRLELTVSPTTHTASGSVRVASNTDHKIKLRVLPKLWTLSPEGLVTYITPPADGFNLLDNLGINPEEFELAPGKFKLVRFIVKVPTDVPNAEYHFQLYFEPTDLLTPKSGENNSGVHSNLDVIPIFTTTVYINQGTPQPALKVSSFTCGYNTQKAAYSTGLSLENPGTRHARVFGNIIVTRQSQAAPIDVLHLANSTLLVVLPNTPRTDQELLLSPSGKHLTPGTYHMDLQLVDERSIQPALTAGCDFTVSP